MTDPMDFFKVKLPETTITTTTTNTTTTTSKAAKWSARSEVCDIYIFASFLLPFVFLYIFYRFCDESVKKVYKFV